VDFFDDDPAQTVSTPSDTAAPPRPPRRRRQSRRWQRLALAAAVLAVLVFIAAWAVRSCQHNRKIDSYQTYMEGVTGAISDSNKFGKQLDGIVADPTRLSVNDLKARLEQLADGQAEIAARVRRFEPPGELEGQQTALVTAMDVRARGFELFRAAMLAVLEKRRGVGAGDIARLEGYFAGPDAYYGSLFYGPARRTMREQEVSDVAVPNSQWYLRTTAFERARLTGMIEQLQQSNRMTGARGVALAGVTVRPSGTRLTAGQTVDVPASAQLSFRVAVQNQGSAIERDVQVKVTLTPPGGEAQEQIVTIAVINPDQTQTIDVAGLTIPAEALSKTSTLVVQAGPVPDERTLDNNKGTFKFTLQLQ
jgi:hypothetical protein